MTLEDFWIQYGMKKKNFDERTKWIKNVYTDNVNIRRATMG